MNQLPVHSCSLASCEFDSRSRDVRGALRCVWSLLCAHRRNSGSFNPPGACEGKVGRGYPDPIRDLPPSGGSDRGRTVHAQSLFPSGDNDWDFGPRTNAFLFGGGCSEPGPRGRSNPSGDGSRDFTVHARSFVSSGKNERDSGSCTEVDSFGRRQPGPGSVHGRLTLRRKANGTKVHARWSNPSGDDDHAWQLRPSGQGHQDHRFTQGHQTPRCLVARISVRAGCSDPRERVARITVHAWMPQPSGGGDQDLTVHARMLRPSGKSAQDHGSCRAVRSLGNGR